MPASQKNQKSAAQALPLVAIILPVLLTLLFVGVELSERSMRQTLLADALRQATRAGVQRFDYRAFAQNRSQIASEPGQRHTGCSNLISGSAREHACAVLLANLRTISNLSNSPEQLAEQVVWQILPDGGTCQHGQQIIASSSQPLVCAAATLTLQGAGLYGSPWQATIIAADTLDPLNK
jgi:hypothetical protein